MNFINEGVNKFVKFGLVGVLNTLINWIIFALLNFIGVYYIVANVIAYVIATANSYIWNSKWVFKYNGKNNKNLAAINYLKDKEIICICPEQLAGMATPRPCAEIVNGVVTDENGNDVDLEYKRAVSMALSQIQHEDIELAILQSRSPTCGVNQIYDGSFTGKLISGMGLFAKALKERGIKVIDVEEVENFNLLDCSQL